MKMSSFEDKEKRAKRLQRDKNAARKQSKIAKTYGLPVEEEHRYEKHHVMDCGIPGCVMCGNPRKIHKEDTIKEKSFIQTQKWDKE